ncbi:MAG: GNAT family N-acetyltransferase [Frankiales bacterium]|nr:GNAT family N-acetyltransferase [Frankiales bacterium]
MAVLPEHRGWGHGITLLGALGSWGTGHGAQRSYLQVEVGNTPARRLYEQTGLVEAYHHHYRRLSP